MTAVLDPVRSAELKERGQQLTLDLNGEWKHAVVEEFRAWAQTQKKQGHRTVTIEMFRAQAHNHPQSHKAWGALPGVLCKAGLIRPVLDEHGNPVYRRAAAPKTHAHPVRLWVAL